MARAVLTVNEITRTGLALPVETVGNSVDGHTVANGSGVFILAHNTNSGSTARTLTVHISKTVDGQAVASRTYSIAAAATKLIGPFAADTYGTALLLDVSDPELKLSAFHVA